jgi:hypothetical protein
MSLSQEAMALREHWQVYLINGTLLMVPGAAAIAHLYLDRPGLIDFAGAALSDRRSAADRRQAVERGLPCGNQTQVV